MHSLGQSISRAEIDEMIKEADSNSDGMVDYADFVKMMTKWHHFGWFNNKTTHTNQVD